MNRRSFVQKVLGAAIAAPLLKLPSTAPVSSGVSIADIQAVAMPEIPPPPGFIHDNCFQSTPLLQYALEHGYLVENE